MLAGAGGLVFRAALSVERDAAAAFVSAQGHLERAKALLATASKNRDQASLDLARKEFRFADRDFQRARDVVDRSPAAWVNPHVPVAGPYLARRVAAVDDLAAMGAVVCDAGLRAADIDALFLQPPTRDQPTGTKRLLTILDQVQAMLPAVQHDLDRARAYATAVDVRVLPSSQRPALEKALGSIATGAAGIAEFERLVPAVRDILAVDGRRTYIVEQANPFELRADGGYIGTYSLLVADHGNLSVTRSGDTHDLPDFSTTMGEPGYVAPPAPMLRLLGRKSWSFEDTNFYPDFPDSARAAASFAQRDFGTNVDGVISIDLYAVDALLGIAGPLATPEGVTLTKDNFIGIAIAHDLADPNHKSLLSSVAGPLMQRLVSLGTDSWPQLIQLLNQLANQRHLQMFFFSNQSQGEMARLGLAGELAFAGHDDFLYLDEANFGGNKANYFLTRKLALALSQSGNSLHHQLTEDLTLDLSKAPLGYEVPYSAYFRLLLPGTGGNLLVKGMASDNQPYMTLPAGVQLVGGSTVMKPAPATRRAHLQIVYSWDTPWTHDSAGGHQLYWQKQPGIDKDLITVAWSAGGKTVTASSDLTTDRLVTLGKGTVVIAQGNAAQVALPKISL